MSNTKRVRNLITENVTIGNDLLVKGTLVTVNLTVSNLIESNISSSTLSAIDITTSNILVTNGLKSIFNSNTIGNIYTTGGNIGINNTSPSYKLDISGSMNVSSSITTSNLNSTNLLTTNISTSNLTGTNLLITNLTGTNLFMSNISTSNLTGTNLLITNISSSTINYVTNLRFNTSFSTISANTTSTRVALICASSTGTQIYNQFQIYQQDQPGGGNQMNIAIGGTNGSYYITTNKVGAGTNLPINIGMNSNYYLTVATNGNIGINNTNPGNYAMDISGALNVSGALSKGSGTFDIEHPLENNKRLIHSFVESPRCDLIYRGKTRLINGYSEINLDKECVESDECSMTEGTFEALCMNTQYFLQNDTSFLRVKGEIHKNILKIRCEETSNDVINWMIIGERQDKFIKNWDKTNSNGNLITEFLVN